MKLFQSLLVAPAVLGLLAPMTAKATEVNLDTISNYNQNEIDLDSNSFKPVLLSGGEGLVDEVSVDEVSVDEDTFSDTTTASFGSTFYVGSVEEGTTEALTFTYDYAIDLSTSFTGEDSFDVAIIGGNADADLVAVDEYMGGDGTEDALTLDGVSYTFPLGSATVIVGDGVGPDDMNTGACAYSAFTDLLGDCGTSNVGGSGDSGFAIGYDFGNGFTMAGGAAGGVGDDESDGLFTEEDASSFALEGAYTTDAFGLSVAYTDDEAVSYWSIQGMLTPEGFPSLSVGYETDDDDADSIFVGITFDEVGPGSVSLGMASTALATTDNYQYELSYSYPLNDGMTITPGVFIAEGDTDETGVVMTTSFSF